MGREKNPHGLTTVTPLLADDNWGNLMAVMPNDEHSAGGGVYYHVDCKFIAAATSNACNK
jgi:hypothetical protein